MLQRLAIPNAYFWSQYDPQHTLPANSYLFVTDEGNAVIDPVACDEATHVRIEGLGGIRAIFLTTADHRRDAQAFAERHNASIVERPRHEERIFPGMFAIRLEHQKTEGEFAVLLPEHRTVVVGDCLIGSPAGAVSMLADEKYNDVQKAALALRRILRHNPQTLLVGHGASLFSGAYEAVYMLIQSRAGAQTHRINVDELEFRDERDERKQQPELYQCFDAEVGWVIGAQKLGYRVSTLAPGKRFCPLHSHSREEEFFFVLEGEPSVRMLSGTIRCRKGDFVAFPVGETGTHQLLNESDEAATVLLVGRTELNEACYYPDSDKLLVDSAAPIAKHLASLLVQASPQLDYFQGE